MCRLPDDRQIYFCETHVYITEKLVKNLADDYRILLYGKHHFQ